MKLNFHKYLCIFCEIEKVFGYFGETYWESNFVIDFNFKMEHVHFN